MITLVDLGSVYWPNWFATQSGIRAFEITIDRIDWLRSENPRIVVCADSPVSIRKTWSESYKANREKKHPDAVDSLVSVLDRVRAWGVPVVQCEGYEGEDIVASVAAQAWPEEVEIAGVDKDLYSLISDTVFIIGKTGRIDSNACYEKWGVSPSQMVDFLALVGDASDNVKGCESCGPGRAADLLERFGSIAGILAASDAEILSVRGVGKKTLDSLRNWDPALAIKLVTLIGDAPVSLDTLWDQPATEPGDRRAGHGEPPGGEFPAFTEKDMQNDEMIGAAE